MLPTAAVTSTTVQTVLTNPSACPPSSFRCQLPTQPTCGGCQNYQPCSSEGNSLTTAVHSPMPSFLSIGSQQCTAYTYQVQLTDCDKIVNGFSQCRYMYVASSPTRLDTSLTFFPDSSKSRSRPTVGERFFYAVQIISCSRFNPSTSASTILKQQASPRNGRSCSDR